MNNVLIIHGDLVLFCLDNFVIVITHCKFSHHFYTFPLFISSNQRLTYKKGYFRNYKLNLFLMNSGHDILKKLNERDTSTLKDFFVEFYPSICVFARNIISETDIIEDIAQEAFLVYWKSQKQFENIDALKGFLYKTAKNKCLNHLKTKKLRTEIVKNGLEKEDYIYELVLEEETYRIIHKAIENLPPQGRRIIELSMKGYKNPEIAEELEVSINTIKTLKGNAYKVLRENLKDHVFVLFLLNQILNM